MNTTNITFHSIYQQLDNRTLVEKRFLAKNFYYKYYIRYTKSTKKRGMVIDNGFKLSKTNKLPTIYKYYRYSRFIGLRGFSLSIKDIYAHHTLEKKLKFKVSYHIFFLRKNNFLKKIQFFLKLYSLNYKNTDYKMLLLSPVKGGFEGLFMGLIGFFPRSQYLFFLERTSTRILRSLDLIQRKYNYYFYELHYPYCLIPIKFYGFTLIHLPMFHKRKKKYDAHFNIIFFSTNDIRGVTLTPSFQQQNQFHTDVNSKSGLLGLDNDVSSVRPDTVVNPGKLLT